MASLKMKLLNILRSIKGRRNVSQSIWDHSSDCYMSGPKKIYWETLSEVAKYQFQMISGSPDKDIQTYIIDYLKDNFTNNGQLSGCILGCSEINGPEIYFSENDIVKSLDIYDISEELIKRQAMMNNNPKLNYIVADLNTHPLPKKKYDFIYGLGTIHHIKNLEFLFDQIKLSLKQDGIFIAREYVGPNCLQLSKKQIDLSNAILNIIPKDYKKTPNGRIKKHCKKINKFILKGIDPTEAIRSSDIMAVLKSKFSILQLSQTGGTLLHPLLNNIAFNFEEKKGKKLLGHIIDIERSLIEQNLIQSDYVFFIAK